MLFIGSISNKGDSKFQNVLVFHADTINCLNWLLGQNILLFSFLAKNAEGIPHMYILEVHLCVFFFSGWKEVQKTVLSMWSKYIYLHPMKLHMKDRMGKQPISNNSWECYGWMHYLEMKGGLLLRSFTLLPLEGKGSTKVFATHSSSHVEQGEDVVGCTLMMNQRCLPLKTQQNHGKLIHP